MSTRYTLGQDARPDEELHDSYGNPIDEDYVEQAVADLHRAVGGRPSLPGKRTRSPQVTFRLHAEERDQAQRLAEEQGVSLRTDPTRARRAAAHTS